MPQTNTRSTVQCGPLPWLSLQTPVSAYFIYWILFIVQPPVCSSLYAMETPFTHNCLCPCQVIRFTLAALIAIICVITSRLLPVGWMKLLRRKLKPVETGRRGKSGCPTFLLVWSWGIYSNYWFLHHFDWIRLEALGFGLLVFELCKWLKLLITQKDRVCWFVLNQPSLNYITLKRFGSDNTPGEKLIKGGKNYYLSLFIYFFKGYYKFTSFRKKTQIKKETSG